MIKSLLCLLLVTALLLCGCGMNYDNTSCAFYYPYESINYSQQDGVIGSHTELIPSGRRDYKSILNRYIQGPTTNGFINPFPAGSAVISVTLDGNNATITINSRLAALKEIELSIACACLVNTVFSLIPVQTVILQAESTFSDSSIYKVYSNESFLTGDNAKELGISKNTED